MELERNLGEQPIAREMGKLQLTPTHLVRASQEQLTHRMVRRAMKGRRLNPKTMGKVCRAMNAAGERVFERSELFNYPTPRAQRNAANQGGEDGVAD